MRQVGWACLLLAVGLAAGCAPVTSGPSVSADEVADEATRQKQFALEQEVRDSVRLWRVGYPLLKAAADRCGSRTVPSTGFGALAPEDLAGEQRTIAVRAYGLKDLPIVMGIAPGSAADRAGMREGDVIETVNFDILPTSADPGKIPPSTTVALSKRVQQGGYKPIAFEVRRYGEPNRIPLILRPDKICDYVFVKDKNDSVNAFADGTRSIITTGMLRFVQSDAELATVMAHELAHNVMRHMDSKQGNVAIGGGLGLLLDVAAAAAGVNTGGAFMEAGMNAGAGAYSQEFETEADYVGIYFMAKAGQDYRRSPDFWRRMAAANPQAITHASTHPTTAQRFVVLSKSIEEIDRKVAAGEPIEPEVREVETPRTGGAEAFERSMQ